MVLTTDPIQVTALVNTVPMSVRNEDREETTAS